MNDNYSTEQQQIINTLAKLLQEFNMDFDIFIRSLRSHYVLRVFATSQNATRTALRCGIDRRVVADILSNKIKRYKRPLLVVIIDEIKARVVSRNRMLPILGINSLAAIVTDRANGRTTANTVVQELEDMGIIEKHGKKIKFLDDPPEDTSKCQKPLKQFVTDLDQLMDDLIVKLKAIRKIYDD